jgi:long-chain acyl-CoA synthetase
MSAVLDPARDLAGARILLTGVTGFVGKVWLAHLLEHAPDAGEVAVLVRPRVGLDAEARWQELVATHPFFGLLRGRWGQTVFEGRMARVRALAGDLTRDGLDLAPDDAQALQAHLDLVVHCAGQVDFCPPLPEAIASNIEGTRRVAGLVAASAHARMVHVSTCYVAGTRRGWIAEDVEGADAARTPAMVDEELDEIRQRITLLRWLHDSEEGIQSWCARLTLQGQPIPARGSDAWTALRRRAWRDLLVGEGLRWAADAGHPNPYTWSKSRAEALVRGMLPPARRTTFRPAIVESALAFPEPGWNEGFNTSGPLIALIGTAFRHLPCRAEQPFDVVPVDRVAHGLTLAASALMRGVHAPVYQCGTSSSHRLTIGRACELTSLGHRTHYRAQPSPRLRALAHVETLPVDWQGVWQAGPWRHALQWLQGGLEDWQGGIRADALPVPAWLEALSRRVGGAASTVRRIEKLSMLFAPFVQEHPQVFEARALASHPTADPDLGWRADGFDWRSYWIDVHMPGIRRWCLPVEGSDPATPPPHAA